MMLVPVLLVLAFLSARRAAGAESGKGSIVVPWFAILFLVVIVFNSLDLIPHNIIKLINTLDTFLLTMAMTALGADTSFDKFRKAGIKPFVLAAVLFCWLIGGGYLLAKFLVPILL